MIKWQISHTTSINTSWEAHWGRDTKYSLDTGMPVLRWVILLPVVTKLVTLTNNENLFVPRRPIRPPTIPPDAVPFISSDFPRYYNTHTERTVKHEVELHLVIYSIDYRMIWNTQHICCNAPHYSEILVTMRLQTWFVKPRYNNASPSLKALLVTRQST